ncbi:MAG: glycosyltransferase family 4 protein [Spirochaetia bacterium]|nr:glycosyltransferase family 4 protein [Spirochaetota bacterium]MDW8113136.1 glycosyltransferase family 4 protein [Spirochaetia bacterium]
MVTNHISSYHRIDDKRFTDYRNAVKGLRVIKLKDRGKKFRIDISLLKFLVRNAKNIDILHRFLYTIETMFYVILYKILNPKGIAYVTLDNDLSTLKDYPYSLLPKYPERKLRKILRNFFVHKILEPIFLRLVDLLSIQVVDGLEILRNIYKKHRDKFFYLPYGIDDEFVKLENIQVKSFDQKENIILTVGRIGSRQKNNEMLFNALEKVDLKNWTVMIVGQIVNPEFEKFLEEFFLRNSHLKEKIVFKGHISDRKSIYNLYNISRIYVLTSLFEGLNLSTIEAGYFANYLIITDVTGAKDITNNGEFGDIVGINDVDGLARKLQFAIDNPDYVREKGEEIRQHVLKNFLWDNIVDLLEQEIRNVLSRRNK